MAGIAAGTVANQFAVDAGTTRPGMLECLQHDHTGSLGEHEAVAVHVKGPAGLLRRIGMKRQRAHVLKSGQPHRRQRRLAAAASNVQGVVAALHAVLLPAHAKRHAAHCGIPLSLLAERVPVAANQESGEMQLPQQCIPQLLRLARRVQRVS